MASIIFSLKILGLEKSKNISQHITLIFEFFKFEILIEKLAVQFLFLAIFTIHEAGVAQVDEPAKSAHIDGVLGAGGHHVHLQYHQGASSAQFLLRSARIPSVLEAQAQFSAACILVLTAINQFPQKIEFFYFIVEFWDFLVKII